VEPGVNIGQYTLVRYLGKGGMAEVWEARHSYLANKGRLAIKFLLPQFATNKELQERFLKEAQRQLEHPNIISALDFFQIDGLSYMVMRYVPPPNPDFAPESQLEVPKSLEDRLAEPLPLSLDEIHTIASDVLSALEHAHSEGVVHRDVKPANILLHRNGHAMLTDFGIAKGLREERSMTRIGTSMGTPDYMSPEQIREPHKVDARSDVYSFGCVLYAMLSRYPPFGSEEDTTEFDIKDRHVRVTPPPIAYWNKETPLSIGDVVYKCLEKDPAKRFQSCLEVNIALGDAISGWQVPAESVSKRATPPPTPPSVPPAVPIDRAQTQADIPVFTPPIRTVTTPIRVSGTPVPTPVPKLDSASTDPVSGFTPVPFATPVPTPVSIPVQAQPPVIPPQPVVLQNASSSSRFRIYLIAGLVLILVAVGAGLAKFYMAPPESASTPDYDNLPYNAPELSNCKGSASCIARKNLATQLMGTDWKSVRFNDTLLRDCMGYQPCVERKAHADALLAVTNWAHADQGLVSDCMQDPQCDQEHLRRVSVVAGHGPTTDRPTRHVDPENLPSCCRDAANPAQCKADKKAAGISGDCPLGH